MRMPFRGPTFVRDLFREMYMKPKSTDDHNRARIVELRVAEENACKEESRQRQVAESARTLREQLEREAKK